MEEIVYSETRKGVMETAQQKHEREDRNYWYWDKAGPWIMPAMAFFLIAMHMVKEWLR